jgi:protein translocase SecG subunit
MSTPSVILSVIQIALAVLLVIAILFQQSEAGLGSAFGGSGGDGEGGGHTRRGAEKTHFQATIALAFLFTIAVLLSLFIS